MASPLADRTAEKRLDSGAWGALLVWIGAVLLADLGWPAFLIGVGLILLAVQVARRMLGLPVEAFWAAVAGLFVLGGLWDLVQVGVGLVPILCIVGGLVLLASALAGRRRRPARSGA